MSLSGVCVTAVESRPAGIVGASQSPSRRPIGARVMAFVALTKPRIIELLLITTVPVMFLAQQGVPDLKLVLLTCVGGYLSAGGANALNMYIDRDIDALMDRTSQRPLVTGMVSPRECLAFGISLGVISTLLDTACGCSVHTTLPTGVGYTSLDLSVKFLRGMAVGTGPVRCEGTLLHLGRSTALAEARLTDAAGRLCAHATSSCLVLRRA